ncbi:MAG TPA: hypothetical protein VL651_15295 [Bacteroidia bacterium]|jgi:hypothetical protein|nr:hypothetical protein [Bacteroidia bacterium]
MNRILVLPFLLIGTLLHSQIYTGSSTNSSGKHYGCYFKIDPDSSIRFTTSGKDIGIYADYTGTIRRVNDSVYHVTTTMRFCQSYFTSPNTDTLYIRIDSSIALQLDEIEVNYADGIHRKTFRGYDTLGRAIALVRVPIDKKLYNRNAATDSVKIIVNRMNPVTNDFLSIQVRYGFSVFYAAGEKLEFDVEIKDDKLRTVNQKGLVCGQLKMKKK